MLKKIQMYAETSYYLVKLEAKGDPKKRSKISFDAKKRIVNAEVCFDL